KRDSVGLGRVPGKNEILLTGECRSDSTEPISVTVHDPPMFAGRVLAETLRANGVRVSGTAVRDRTARQQFLKGQAGLKLVAELQTPLVPVILARCNKDSMNQYAECLCKRLGFAVSGQSGSWANGTAAVAGFMKKIDVDASQFHMLD